MDIRTIAIIAHVDHGKTKLTDALLRFTGMVKDREASMDSNPLELERGITIYSKNASLEYKGTKINLVDTPGHTDFGSEVERIVRAIDSVVLVVDAQEGPMPQTRFVLRKALELGLKPMVVINKVDKAAARCAEVPDEIFELFLDLDASEEQLNFPVLYAVAKQGRVGKTPEEAKAAPDVAPLLDLILAHVPVASSPEKSAQLLRAQPFNLGYDTFLGRLAISRIYEGTVRAGMAAVVRRASGETRAVKVTKVFSFRGLERVPVDSAGAGDLVVIAGIPDIDIGETICAQADQVPLPAISVDEPTIAVDFLVNSSPGAGIDGTRLTSREIRERLERELEVNVGLQVDFSAAERFVVSGRGELHLAILLENMRREGFELMVSQPQVIVKQKEGQKLEPFEEVTIDIPSEYSGAIMQKLSTRRGELKEMKPVMERTRLIYEIPTRALFGYRSDFLVDTRGEGILCRRTIGFRPWAGPIDRHQTGSMVSQDNGKAVAYSLNTLQLRGPLYVAAGDEVYEGMVIGATLKGDSYEVNPIKGKNLTNVRAAGSDENILLTPPVELTLEKGLGLVKDDEYLEVTPKHIRLRKKFLTANERIRVRRSNNAKN